MSSIYEWFRDQVDAYTKSQPGNKAITLQKSRIALRWAHSRLNTELKEIGLWYPQFFGELSDRAIKTNTGHYLALQSPEDGVIDICVRKLEFPYGLFRYEKLARIIIDATDPEAVKYTHETAMYPFSTPTDVVKAVMTNLIPRLDPHSVLFN